MDDRGYYARVDAFVKALPWDEGAQHGEPEHIGTVAGRLGWTAVNALVAALDAEALGYAELIPPDIKIEKRPEMYGVRLTESGHLRLVELTAAALTEE